MDNEPATLVEAGYYASDDHTQAIPASPGYYIPDAGAQGAGSQIAAALGTFVPGFHATEPVQAPAGTYVDTVAATTFTPAPPGSYVPTAGATAPTLASAGTYVPTSGQVAPLLAPAGTYVPTVGATQFTVAQPGYFVSATGQVAQTASAAGFFVPTAGAIAQIPDPPGTTSHVASVAARSSAQGVSRGGSVVGPEFSSVTAPGATIDLGTINGSQTFSLTLANASSDLGFADTLTDLSILSVTFAGPASGQLTALNLLPGLVLHEQGSFSLQFSIFPLGTAPSSATLYIGTDAFAPYGEPGSVFSYPIVFNSVPEPSSGLLFALGVAGIFIRLRRRRSGSSTGVSSGARF